jgi:hypothetical protein
MYPSDSIRQQLPLLAACSWLNAIGDGSNGQYDALLGHLHDWTMDVYDYFHVTCLQKGAWEQACRFRLSYSYLLLHNQAAVVAVHKKHGGSMVMNSFVF